MRIAVDSYGMVDAGFSIETRLWQPRLGWFSGWVLLAIKHRRCNRVTNTKGGWRDRFFFVFFSEWASSLVMDETKSRPEDSRAQTEGVPSCRGGEMANECVVEADPYTLMLMPNGCQVLTKMHLFKVTDSFHPMRSSSVGLWSYTRDRHISVV